MKIERKYLEIMFDSVKDLLVEPCVKLSPEGMSISSFTPCNSSHCFVEIPKEKFINYEDIVEQKFKVQSEVISKIMKRLKTQFINLRIENEQLFISDENKKEYSVALLYDEDVQKDVPQMELNSNFKMKSVDLQNIFLDASVVTDTVKLTTKENKITLNGGELNKFNYELDYETKGRGKATYSLEYLNKFMNSSKYFENVLFEFSSDNPCRLTFDGELKIQFILAPRVLDD